MTKPANERSAWSSWHFARVGIGGSSNPDEWTARGIGVIDGGGSRQGEEYKEFKRASDSETKQSNARPKKRAKG